MRPNAPSLTCGEIIVRSILRIRHHRPYLLAGIAFVLLDQIHQFLVFVDVPSRRFDCRNYPVLVIHDAMLLITQPSGIGSFACQGRVGVGFADRSVEAWLLNPRTVVLTAN